MGRPVWILLIAASLLPGQAIKIRDWERGFAFEPVGHKDHTMHLWFYEWTLFDAILPGQHNRGTYDFYREVNKDQTKGEIKSQMFHLTATAVPDGAELLLRVTNRTDNEWPELAGVIPCFNPGRLRGTTSSQQTPATIDFADKDQKHTWFVGPRGLEPLVTRAIHFNDRFRAAIDRQSNGGEFVFSSKWPTSPVDASAGLIVRESSDGGWITAIAWEDYLSVQGHNPWYCMHHSVRIGPLKPDESKTIRGRIFLFQGSKDDVLRRYRASFGK